MVQYVDKSALLAEIKGRINGINLDSIDDWRYRLQREHDIEVMKNILSLIDTLEVKEIGVDLGNPKGDKSAKCIIDTESLEAKEVDLDFQMFAKEMDTVLNLPSSETKNTEEEPLNWEYAIAKHFYSLGLAQKEEEV